MLSLYTTEPLNRILVRDLFRIFPHFPLRPNVSLQLTSNSAQDLYENHAEEYAMIPAKNNLN